MADEMYKPVPPSVPLQDYVDAGTASMQGEMDRRFETVLREINQRFTDHEGVHAREREALQALKLDTAEWRRADNEFRAQLTKERGDYVQRKEIWSMLAATGGVIIALVTVVYFVIYAVRGGH